MIDVLDEGTPPLQEGDISTGEISSTRNAPDCCHWCGDAFKPPKRKRFVIMDEVNHSGGWGLVSICFECFKRGGGASSDSGLDLSREQRECAGCGEPISIPIGFFRGSWRWFRWCVCSNRCYQRAYRKRRRRHGSTIDWKCPKPARRCEACKAPLPGERRSDSKFCSSKCRQWHYRRRKENRRNPPP